MYIVAYIFKDVYYDTIGKYQILGKLEILVRNVIEGQASILMYICNVLVEYSR